MIIESIMNNRMSREAMVLLNFLITYPIHVLLNLQRTSIQLS
jgi:hypothetical protein